MERSTQQRKAVKQVFLDNVRPLDPNEVLSFAKKLTARIGIATVYRAIREFVDEGFLRQVQLPGQTSRYEPAGKDHHHYFHCRACRKTYDVNDCPGDIKRLTPRGFILEDHEVVLYGLCKACRK